MGSLSPGGGEDTSGGAGGGGTRLSASVFDVSLGLVRSGRVRSGRVATALRTVDVRLTYGRRPFFRRSFLRRSMTNLPALSRNPCTTNWSRKPTSRIALTNTPFVPFQWLARSIASSPQASKLPSRQAFRSVKCQSAINFPTALVSSKPVILQSLKSFQ